ncbi:MAG: hypothetical protein VYE15_02900 [Myxococcota bacterium]|nr:hypothetical protein [Myxococcota bacterium]
MAVLSWLAQMMAALLGGGILAALLGSLSWGVFVVALLPLCVGVGAGAGALLGALVTRGEPNRGSLVAACLAVVGGWLIFQAFDDHHFRQAWAVDLAQAQAAASGMAGESPSPEDEVAFFAPDAPEALSREVKRQVGFDGPVARWWLRAHQGVRLLGPWEASRGLPVGPWGALAWGLAELVLGCWVARRVLARGAPSGPEGDDLQGHSQ